MGFYEDTFPTPEGCRRQEDAGRILSESYYYMPQVQMPLFPQGTTELTSHLAFQARDGRVTYFYGHLPVFIHDEKDLRTFRMITSQFIVNGVVRQSRIIKAFGLPPVTVKRYVKLYRTKGTAGFFQEPQHRGPVVLTKEVLVRAQELLDEGLSRSATAAQVGIKANTLAKAIRAGRLHEGEKKLHLPAGQAGSTAPATLRR
jgi:hypothetical protein